MTRKALLLLYCGLATLCDRSYAWSHDPKPTTTKAERRVVRVDVRDFSLTDQSGRPFQFQSLKGKVVLVAFAYTTCPDVCPLITAAMRAVQRDLNQTDSGSIHFLTVTTDPEVDSPKVLRSYAERYDADLTNWSFLSGEQRVLEGVWKNFGVRVRRKARGLIDHTSLTALVDQNGVMRIAYYGMAPDAKAVLRDIRGLLSRP
ncbi:MAG TPA: SCO family protein [Candidatus Binatia bacterium]|nr:SCO family protein [Candidatus Binatia bacterium]